MTLDQTVTSVPVLLDAKSAGKVRVYPSAGSVSFGVGALSEKELTKGAIASDYLPIESTL